MANNDICVFCGAHIGFFPSSSIRCGNVFQPSCRSCAQEMEQLSEEPCCRALHHPDHVARNQFIAHLIRKDTGV